MNKDGTNHSSNLIQLVQGIKNDPEVHYKTYPDAVCPNKTENKSIARDMGFFGIYLQ